MTKGQEQVKDFMRFFGQATPDKPTPMNEATSSLRGRLILEEGLETLTKGLGVAVCLTDENGQKIVISEKTLAWWLDSKNGALTFVQEKETDMKELADGLADLAYVGEFGTAVAAGIDLEPIQDEIHASNMTKAWTEADLEQAKLLYPEATVENYGGGLYRLVRPDGKIIKSPSYRAANILPLIEAQSN